MPLLLEKRSLISLEPFNFLSLIIEHPQFHSTLSSTGCYLSVRLYYMFVITESYKDMKSHNKTK